MLRNLPQVDTGAPVSRPLPPATLLWPSGMGWGDLDNGDSTTFPKLSFIKARFNANPLPPLVTFLDAVAEAQERVWIVDDYLLKPVGAAVGVPDRATLVLAWFPQALVANDVRLLTSGGNTEDNDAIAKRFGKHADGINERRRRRAGILQIQVKFTLQEHFPYVHDRFAVVDDELWHFGATVGGLHPQVSAASRGWRAQDCDALEFFESAWSGDSDRRRGR